MRDDAPNKRKNPLMIRDKTSLVPFFLKIGLKQSIGETMISGPMTIICFIPFITVYAMIFQPESDVIITQYSYLVRSTTHLVTRSRKYITALNILTKIVE